MGVILHNLLIVQIEHGEKVRLDVERTKTITNESERGEKTVILHEPSAHWGSSISKPDRGTVKRELTGLPEVLLLERKI